MRNASLLFFVEVATQIEAWLRWLVVAYILSSNAQTIGNVEHQARKAVFSRNRCGIDA